MMEKFIEEINDGDGVELAPHRFGGVEFRWGRVEIGHVRVNCMEDHPFTHKTREVLL
jgi:hypothetical protein